MDKTSVELSIPRTMTVRGYEIRRLPLGRYLEALEILRAMPEDAMRACFPGKTAADALAVLKDIKADALPGLFLQIASALPAQGMRLLSVLTGIGEKALLEDDRIGLDGAAEMVKAAITLNKIENFLEAVREIAGRIRTAATSDGFSA